ncbi:MAG TPA: ribonuclease J, partial [Cryobacterium sp.]|nr:ribonuclease J [Cryobacterium sp.]
HRIQQVLDQAHAHGRKVAFVGRSMVRNMGIARDLGYLTIPRGLVVDFKKLETMPDEKVTLICTGSQGEPMAALARMANGDHQIRVGEGDTVLLASSLIPGNESAIYGIINKLMDLGARVVHKGNAKVHVSGHASAGELVYCYNIVKPKNVLPYHGEWRHLKSNADLAIRTGVPEDQVLVVEDGVVVDLVDGVAKVTGRVAAELVFVHGMTVGGGGSEEALADRVQLSNDGAVTILGILDTRTGLLTEPVEFIARGFVQDNEWIQGATKSIDDALRAANKVKIVNGAELEDIFTQSLTRWMQRKYRRIPVITSVVVDA